MESLTYSVEDVARCSASPGTTPTSASGPATSRASAWAGATSIPRERFHAWLNGETGEGAA